MAESAPPALHVPLLADEFDARPIVTPRLTLRPLVPEDAADVYAYQRIDEVLRFIPWPMRNEAGSTEHTVKRAGMRTLAIDGDALFLAAVLRGEPSLGGPGSGDRVIGDYMLRIASVESADVELGWVSHPDFHGRGLATEAASALLPVAFDRLNAHRVHASLDPRNGASAAVCRKIGLRHESTTVETYWAKDEWSDAATYALLAREWSARGASRLD